MLVESRAHAVAHRATYKEGTMKCAAQVEVEATKQCVYPLVNSGIGEYDPMMSILNLPTTAVGFINSIKLSLESLPTKNVPQFQRVCIILIKLYYHYLESRNATTAADIMKRFMLLPGACLTFKFQHIGS